MPYQVLIVDDDIPMLDWLGQLEWEKIGCHVAGLCNTARQALAIIQQQPIHVLITDIVMPGMDGLQLTHALRQESPSSQVILIPAYQDFSYAQVAIRENVHEYLIKGLFDQEELFAAVERAVASLSSDSQSAERQAVYPAAFALLWGADEKMLDALAEKLGRDTFWLPGEKTDTVYFLSSGRSPEEFFSFFQKALSEMQYLFPGQEIYASLGKQAMNKEEIALLAEGAHQALFYQAIPWKAAVPDETLLVENTLLEESLLREISGMAPEALAAFLSSNGRALREEKKMHPANVRMGVVRWLLESGARQTEQMIPRVVHAPSINALIGCVEEFGKTLIRPGQDQVLDKALQYIHNNYHLNITLRDAAHQAGYTPNYFGNLFKKRMGRSFRAYLNEVRLEKAHQYMLTTSMSVTEVMRWVGLSDYRYFIQQYRAHFGCTPQSTRKEGK